MPFKKYLVLLCFASSMLIGNAQVLFSERNGFEFAASLYTNIKVIGDTVYLTGVAYDTSQNSGQIQSKKNFTAVVDINGNYVRHQVNLARFGEDYETFSQSFIKTRNNEFAMCGLAIIPDTENSILLIKYDSKLNTKEIKEFRYPDSVLFTAGQSMLELDNGNLLIAGFIQNPSGLCQITLLKIDSTENILWWKSYDSDGLVDIYPYILQIDSTTILVGFEHNDEILDPLYVTSHTRFLVVDTGGNLRSRVEDPNDSTFTTHGLQRTLDGGYAYCGRYTYKTSAPYNIVFTWGAITKLNSNLSLEWRYVNRDTSNFSDMVILNQLHQLPDSTFVAVGEGVNFDPDPYHEQKCGWIVKVSSQGEKIWSRMYFAVTAPPPGYANHHTFYDFQVLSDGGYLICGESVNGVGSYPKAQAWLIRLDSMGCLIPGCDTITATGISQKIIGGSNYGFVTYPNPASNKLYVLTKTDEHRPSLTFEIYSLTGTC